MSRHMKTLPEMRNRLRLRFSLRRRRDGVMYRQGLDAKFFRAVVENIAEYVAVLDTCGRRIYNSSSYGKLFGHTDAMRGTDSFANIHPEDREYVRGVFRDTVRSGVGRIIEYRFLLPDGTVRHMESRGAVVHDDSGRVQMVIVTAADVTERKLVEERMREFAYCDALTALPNRRLLVDHIWQSIRVSHRTDEINALIFIDLDDFKPINDEYGHDAGDRVLCEAARRAKAGVREVDTVARLGGDEFVVLLRQVSHSPAIARHVVERAANNLVRSLAMPYRIEVGRQQTVERQCTSSVGVAFFGAATRSPEEAMSRADAAMYLAKDAGGNCVRYSDSPEPSEAICTSAIAQEPVCCDTFGWLKPNG